MSCAAIAFGGNLPESPTAVEHAVSALQDSVGHVTRRSSLHVTRPMGANAGSEFINGALLLETELSPVELLQRLLQIETSLGRTRSQRWEPRVIDLDVVLYDEVVSETAELTVPHPAMWYRRFVLAPLAEIAPDMRHPITGLAVKDLAARLDRRPIAVELDFDESPIEFAESVIASAAAAFHDGLLQLRLSDKSSMDPGSVFARIELRSADRSGVTERQRPFVIRLVGPALNDRQADIERIVQDIRDIVTAVTG